MDERFSEAIRKLEAKRSLVVKALLSFRRERSALVEAQDVVCASAIGDEGERELYGTQTIDGGIRVIVSFDVYDDERVALIRDALSKAPNGVIYELDNTIRNAEWALSDIEENIIALNDASRDVPRIVDAFIARHGVDIGSFAVDYDEEEL
jgi:transposase InsO family protein